MYDQIPLEQWFPNFLHYSTTSKLLRVLADHVIILVISVSKLQCDVLQIIYKNNEINTIITSPSISLEWCVCCVTQLFE